MLVVWSRCLVWAVPLLSSCLFYFLNLGHGVFEPKVSVLHRCLASIQVGHTLMMCVVSMKWTHLTIYWLCPCYYFESLLVCICSFIIFKVLGLSFSWNRLRNTETETLPRLCQHQCCQELNRGTFTFCQMAYWLSSGGQPLHPEMLSLKKHTTHTPRDVVHVHCKAIWVVSRTWGLLALFLDFKSRCLSVSTSEGNYYKKKKTSEGTNCIRIAGVSGVSWRHHHLSSPRRFTLSADGAPCLAWRGVSLIINHSMWYKLTF